ncbi:MAG: DUF362 domain-containing protein [Halodesulfovibrio sp.]
MSDSRIPVALTRCADYAPDAVESAVRSVLDAAGVRPSSGTRVLVKPNLLKAEPGGLCCTHPMVVRAACLYLMDCGCKVTVGDSPAFGSAGKVAQSIGLADALAPLGVPIITLDNPVAVTLPYGMSVGISRHALETDTLLSVPRVKAHTQMRVTCAVKNMFGCVAGVRKALAHTTHGDKGNAFRAMLVEVAAALPPTAALVDGVVGMDRTGPSGGDAYALGMVGAAQTAVALDTAVYAVLGATPEMIPLWGELRSRNTQGAFAEQLRYPMLSPEQVAEQVAGQGFRFPGGLTPETFHPLRLLRSAVKRWWMARS